MTSAELKAKLIADPGYAFYFILDNNPEAVANNLRALDFNVPDQDSAAEALTQLIAEKRWDALLSACSVELDPEKLDANEIKALTEAVAALSARMGTGNYKRSGGLDVAALLGGLASGTIFYLQQTGDSPEVSGGTGGGGSGSMQQAPPKNNTMLYVGIGVVLLVVVIVVVIIVKKKAGK